MEPNLQRLNGLRAWVQDRVQEASWHVAVATGQIQCAMQQQSVAFSQNCKVPELLSWWDGIHNHNAWRNGQQQRRGYQSQSQRLPRHSFFVPLCSISVSGGASMLPAFGSNRSNPAPGDANQSKEIAGGAVEEERILISEVEVVGVDGALRSIAQNALTTKPNFAYTSSEVKADLHRVFDTGYFRSVEPDAEDTRDGVRLVIKVKPNPELRGIVATGANVLPNAVIQDVFAPLYGKTLNFKHFMKAVDRLDRWYHNKGVLGQVIDFQEQGGVVELAVAEAVVDSLQLHFVDGKTGDPKDGKTKPHIVLRHFTTQPGQVYNLKQAKQDLDSLYSTGLFEDVNIDAKEADSSSETSPRVNLIINLVERKSGGLGAGTGISAQSHAEGAMPGFVGSFTYTQRNLFGLNQKLSALVELGRVDSIFRLQHTDPWVNSDPHRTSRTLQLMNTRTSGNAIHGRAENEEDDGTTSNVILGRLIGGVEYRRPLAPSWTGSFGASVQRTRCMDERNRSLTQDRYGSPLTFSGGPSDSVALTSVSAQYQGAPSNTRLLLSMEQALPLRPEWLNFNRVQATADLPMPFGPFTLNLLGKAGMVYGDLPPYEAFAIGGTNSVRGYAEGGVASGRYCVSGTAELITPLVKPLQGTLFFDYGTDLDSGSSVIGDPAGARGKPGRGYGYGAGVRVDSPLGPLRLELAWNDHGQRRFHVGLGAHG